MKRLRCIPFMAAFFLLSLAQEPSKLSVAAEPVSAERLGIYRDFLTGYKIGFRVKAMLNVAQITIAFNSLDYGNPECLTGFSVKDQTSPAPHTFAAEAFSGMPVQLIDPAAHKIQDAEDTISKGGVLTLSEIVFDATHTRAAFTYFFHCRGLCGDGGTVVYDLIDGSWKRDLKVRCHHIVV